MTENQEIFGNVITIDIGGKEVKLKPTLGCCMALAKSPGLEVLRQRVLQYDLEAMCVVIAAGVGQNAKEIPTLILKAGMTNIMPSLNEFLVGIATGGIVKVEQPGELTAGN